MLDFFAKFSSSFPIILLLAIPFSLLRICSLVLGSCSEEDNLEKETSVEKCIHDLNESVELLNNDCIKELSKDLRKNDNIKITSVAQSFDNFNHARDIPHRCPYCWGRPDDSGIC